MKKLFFIVISCLLFSSVSFAQQTTRTLAAQQLFLYGQAVYDRGDYPQAAVIISRVLQMDPTQKEALEYARNLKNKGLDVFIPLTAEARHPSPEVNQSIPQPQPEKPKKLSQVLAKQSSETSQVPVPGLVTVNFPDNTDLRQAIQDADAAIEKLKSDISDLRTQIVQGQKEFQDSKVQP